MFLLEFHGELRGDTDDVDFKRERRTVLVAQPEGERAIWRWRWRFYALVFYSMLFSISALAFSLRLAWARYACGLRVGVASVQETLTSAIGSKFDRLPG